MKTILINGIPDDCLPDLCALIMHTNPNFILKKIESDYLHSSLINSDRLLSKEST